MTKSESQERMSDGKEVALMRFRRGKRVVLKSDEGVGLVDGLRLTV